MAHEALRGVTPTAARQIRDALHDAYARCGTRAELFVIILDAIDQSGAPLSVQHRIQYELAAWDSEALRTALSAWERSGR